MLYSMELNIVIIETHMSHHRYREYMMVDKLVVMDILVCYFCRHPTRNCICMSLAVMIVDIDLWLEYNSIVNYSIHQKLETNIV